MEQINLEQLFISHQEFSIKTFPKSTWVSSLRGLEREIKEVEEASKVSWENWVTEYVDCQMYLLDSMARAGVDMTEFKRLFKRKMLINNDREWKQNKDGSYSHIK